MRRRGVSFPGALLLLALLTLVTVGLLNVFDRSTRMVRFEGPTLELGVSIRAAAHALSRDVRAAGAGIPPWLGLIARANNTPVGTGIPTASGRVAVRAGTDQLEVRGVLSTPVFRLDPSPRPRSGETTLRIPASRRTPAWIGDASPGAFGLGTLDQEGWGALVARLSGVSGAKTFFAVGDDEGRLAVAVVRSAELDGGGVQRGLLLHVTFDDPDAHALAPGGTAAVSRLRALATGGALDDLTYFVARGEEGGPPDYFTGADPESLGFPHPYLAVARYLGSGRYEVLRIADEIEDFQVAYLLRDGSWVGAAGVGSTGRLVDDLGLPLVRFVRIGLVEKSPVRDLRVELSAGGAPASRQEGFRLLDAPVPAGTRFGPGPVGWSASASQRVSFERRAQLLGYAPRNLQGGGL